MMKVHFPVLMLAVAALRCAFASSAIAATVPVTSGLIVNLNGDSTSNFLSSSGKVQVWYDLAHDGSNASQQDYGVNASSSRPSLLTNQDLGNGTLHAILDFDRGTVTTPASQTGGADSQFLGNKSPTTARITTFGDTFTEGTDGAYGSTGKLTWFTVFNLDFVDNSDTQGPATQAILTARRTTGTATSNIWRVVAYDDASGPDVGTNVELVSHGRSSGNALVGGITSDIAANQWYIAASSWDSTTGTIRTVVKDSSGGLPLLDVTATGANQTVLNQSYLARLGRVVDAAGLTALTAGQMLDGQIAEVLIYNEALGTEDMNSVLTYLDNKYFVPEPSSFALVAMAGIGIAVFVRRRSHSS